MKICLPGFSIFHLQIIIFHRLLLRAVLSDDVKMRQSSLFSMIIAESNSGFTNSLRSSMRSQIEVSFNSLMTMPNL